MRPDAVRGQVILAALLVFVLVLSIAVGISRTSMFGARLGQQFNRRAEARNVAEGAVAYARAALEDAFITQTIPPTFDGVQVNQGPRGEKYTIRLDYPTAYQIVVTARALAADGLTPVGSVIATVSAYTVGVTLPTKEQYGVALDLAQIPQVNGTLNVHWGSIAIRPSNPTGQVWAVPEPLDSQRRPRKFSTTGIRSATSPTDLLLSRSEPPSSQHTDEKEYWAYTPLDYRVDIDESIYSLQATRSTVPAPDSLPTSGNAPAAPPTSGLIQVVNGFNALFDAPAPGYRVSYSSAAIYIQGNAIFRRVDLDVYDSRYPSGVVVTENLTLEDRQGSGHVMSSTTTVRGLLKVPDAAGKEYPYSTNYPCAGLSACSSADASLGLASGGAVPFRGFLYVKGNLVVAPNTDWVIVGTLRVDGQLQIGAGATLTVLYDDSVNAAIRMTRVQTKVESLRYGSTK